MSSKFLLLLTLVVLQASALDFQSKKNETLADFRPIDIEYSPDQSFVAAADRDGHMVRIFNGHNLNTIQTITFNTT